MNCYETLFVVKPTLTEEEITSQIQKVKDALAKENGTLLATNDMGMRKLAYPVDKHLRGYYTVFYYQVDGASIAEIERNLKVNENIIKFLTIKYSKKHEVKQFDSLVEKANKTVATEA
ncbi:MAG TPA: 30S ribosomal protein S6 [Epsilonproteobacteria bacterium]|nr:30S ribosomal protein S6 [Campylobacterota bacterium]